MQIHPAYIQHIEFNRKCIRLITLQISYPGLTQNPLHHDNSNWWPIIFMHLCKHMSTYTVQNLHLKAMQNVFIKKLTCKGTLRQVLICLRPKTTYLLPLARCMHVYRILIHTGKGGGAVEPESRLEEQQFTKLDRKYQHGWLYLKSINPDKHLPQNPFTGPFF